MWPRLPSFVGRTEEGKVKPTPRLLKALDCFGSEGVTGLNRTTGVVVSAVSAIGGIAGLALYSSFGPYTNGGLIGEFCVLLFGILFVVGLIILAVGKATPPPLMPPSERPP